MVQFQNFQHWVINVNQMDSPNTKNQPNDWYVQNWHTPFWPILAILGHLNQVPEGRNCLVYWHLDIKPDGMYYPGFLSRIKLKVFFYFLCKVAKVILLIFDQTTLTKLDPV